MKQLQRIQRARQRLIIKNPFFGVLATRLKIVESNKFETMVTNGTKLFFNTDFVAGLSDPELTGVIVHEVLHCSNQHFARLMGRDKEQFNIAADYAINPIVLNAGFELPKSALIDQNYSGLGAEEIYRLRESKSASADNQQAQGKPGNDQSDQGQFGEFIEPDQDSVSADNQSPQALAESWQIATRQAAMVASKQAGHMPGYIQDIIAGLNESAIDWKAILADWISDKVQIDYSFSRPNKRFIHAGLYLPSAIPDGIDHVCFVIDTSASMDKQALESCFAEIAGLLESGFINRLTVIQTDTKVNKVTEYQAGDCPILDIYGRGGTNFIEAMGMVADEYSDCAGCIVFTDLEVSREHCGHDPAIPVLWAVTGNSRDYEHYSKIPVFGETMPVQA